MDRIKGKKDRIIQVLKKENLVQRTNWDMGGGAKIRHYKLTDKDYQRITNKIIRIFNKRKSFIEVPIP